MSSNKFRQAKKEIFLPAIIGDWTTYSFEKHHETISVSKSIGGSTKTLSEEKLDRLLIFHYELFDMFFKKVTSEINYHTEIESVSIDSISQKDIHNIYPDDIYQCKFSIPDLEQIDIIMNRKTAALIIHRLCGGSTKPETFKALTNIEVSLMSVINNLFFNNLFTKWKKSFPFIENNFNAHYGLYKKVQQQSNTDSLLLIESKFKLFNQSNLSINLIYSLSTIEKLLDREKEISQNVIPTMSIPDQLEKKISIPIKSSIGSAILTLNEIQDLEIGDVVSLDNQNINQPIQLMVNNCITFSGTPITINNNKIGFQIINCLQYKNQIEESKKPIEGSFTASKSDQVTQETEPTNLETEPTNLETEPTNLETEPTNLETEPATEMDKIDEDNTKTEETETDKPPFDTEDTHETDSTVEDIEETSNNDNDFLWDDLDEEK